MKKLIFFLILTGIAVKLKAQQKSTEKPFEKFKLPNAATGLDTLPNLSFYPKNKPNTPLLPQEKQLLSGNLYAKLDHMPIVKPVGKWKMPIIKPDASTNYTMPIKRLPAIIKSNKDDQKINP